MQKGVDKQPKKWYTIGVVRNEDTKYRFSTGSGRKNENFLKKTFENLLTNGKKSGIMVKHSKSGCGNTGWT